jgi:cobalt-zinc-cadmium efflux system membrane fusion protein
MDRSVGLPSIHRHVRRGAAAVAGVLLLGGVSAMAYKHVVPESHAVAEVRDVPRLDGRWIRYSSAFAKRSNVVLEPCAKSSLSPVVSVTGTVTFDPQLVAAIGSRISGRVRSVYKFDGDEVRAGEVIAELESAELGNAQAALLAAQAHADAATTNEQRQADLFQNHAASEREAELARAAGAVARAELVAAQQKVRALGGTSGGAVGVLALKTPIDGKVIEMKVSRGQSVEPTSTIARVADLRRVWIQLDVFEREVGHIRKGDAVEISPQTNQSVVVKGEVAHVGDVIDLDTRSAPVRVVVDNADGSLRPGQSVLARIRTGRTTAAAVAVPIDAVTSIDGKATIFVAHDDTSVEPRTVTLGPRDATHVIVASGLEEGERIVVKGVFALKSEVFR